MLTSAIAPPSHDGLGPVARRRLAMALFVLTWLTFVATASGRYKTIDIQTEFRVAASLVYSGNLTSDRNKDTTVGIDGRPYSNHLIGESILLIPAALLDGGLLTSRAEVGIAMINPLFAAASVTVFFLLLLDLGVGARTGVGIALCFAFATLTWPYAHDAFDVTPNAFLILLAVWAARRRAHAGGWRWLLISGVAMAAGLLLRYSTGILVLPLVGYLAWASRGRGAFTVVREALTWFLPVVAAAAVLASLNLARFGDPFNIGYPHPPEAYIQPVPNQALSLVGFLVSPGKGLLLFSPILLLAFWGLPKLLRRDRAFALLLVMSALLTMAFYARLTNWSGDFAWGPRYLVPVAPLLMVLVAAHLADWRALPRHAQLAAAALAGLGVALNASVVLTGYERAIEAISPGPPSDMASNPGYYFIPAHSQLVEQVRSVWVMFVGPNPFGQYARVDGSLDYTWLYTPDFWWASPWQVPAYRPLVVLVAFLLAAILGLATLRLARTVRAAATPATVVTA